MKSPSIHFLFIILPFLLLTEKHRENIHKNADIFIIKNQISAAQTIDANQLIQQGIEYYKNGQIEEAIASWKQALIDDNNLLNQTQVSGE